MPQKVEHVVRAFVQRLEQRFRSGPGNDFEGREAARLKLECSAESQFNVGPGNSLLSNRIGDRKQDAHFLQGLLRLRVSDSAHRQHTDHAPLLMWHRLSIDRI